MQINSVITEQSTLPIIPVRIDNVELMALIDSGAAISIAKRSILGKIDIDKVTEIKECLRVTGVAGNSALITESMITKISIKGQIFKHKFYVCDKLGSPHYSMILGQDFLQVNNFVINFGTKTISNNLFSMCWEKGDKDEISCNVVNINSQIGRNKSKYFIPPRSELLLRVHTKLNFDSKYVLIQPTDQSFNAKWVISSSLNESTNSDSYWIKVGNFTDEVLHINKNTKLVVIEPVEAILNKPVNVVEVEDNKGNLDLFGGQFSLSHLNESQKAQMLDLLNKHKSVFANQVSDLTGCNTINHRIYLTDDIPVRSKPYRTPHALRNELKKQVGELLEAGIISESDSAYASPVILVKKRNGSYRLVCDYRKLNLKTQPLSFPLPLIADIIDSLEGGKFFSSLDLCSGYWQMNLDPRDRHKTAFCTDFGLYAYSRLPQGLRNAASSFQRLLEIVLVGLKEFNINTYLDDLIIASAGYEEHLQKLDMLFSRLSLHNLKVNPAKCQLAQTEINYLGFKIKEGKIYPEDRNILAVKRFPIPDCKKKVRSFLGLCNFYRKFIKDFAEIALPLTNLTKGKIKFKWDDRANEAFNKLKEALINYPCLILPNVNKEFIIHTDASSFAIGSVLSQIGEDNELHPIGYASRRLKEPEVNYSVYDKELLGIVWGINNFRHYLFGRRFTLFCDQQSLSHALTLKDSGRVTRWALNLQNYDYVVKHTPGKCNIPADVLSRNVNVITIDKENIIASPFSNDRLISLQEEDAFCTMVHNLLKDKDRISLKNIEYFKRDGILYCYQKSKLRKLNRDKLVVPRALITEVLEKAHDSVSSAHPGYMRTLYRVRTNYFWEGMSKIILNYIKSCPLCVKKRGYRKGDKAPLQRSFKPQRPFEAVGMDAVGPLPLTYDGNKHIIVICDYFTKWAEAYAVPDLRTETVALVFEKFIATHGVPERLITDRGTSFLSEAIKAVYNKLKIDKHSTTSFHPSADGMVEKTNSTVVNALKNLVEEAQEDWDKYIHLALLAYRTSFQSAIKDTPAHLVYGRDLVLPLDIINGPAKFSYADHRD